MNKAALIFLAGAILLVTSCEKYQVILENSSEMGRTDEGIVIERSLFGKIADENSGLLPSLSDSNGNIVPTQADDLDGDGKWDELFVVTDFEGGETKVLSLQFIAPEEYPLFEVRTNIRFAKKDEDYREVTEAVRETHATNTITQQVWQMEGIAWENDKIGFRNYFDRRNGMDIFGKVTSRMVLDEVGYKENPSYHEYNPEWGVDVLKVGNSLGAGSIAYQLNDSLYRVGDNGAGSCRVLIEGPLRSIFRFEFTDWNAGDQRMNVTHDVAIQAGKYYYDNRVSYAGTESNVALVTGIVNKYSDNLYEMEDNNGYVAYYTHDLQSEDTTLLGMGLLVARADLLGTSETAKTGDGITETYCVHLKASANKATSFRFYSVWEREDDRWKTAEGFNSLLKEEAEKMSNPVVVKVE